MNTRDFIMHEFLVEKLKESDYSDNEITQIIDGLSLKKYTTFRVNNIKSDKISIINTLESLDIKYIEKDDFPDAIILPYYDSSRGQNFDIKTGLRLDTLDMYKSGKIYVQNLSSMIPVYVLEPKDKENILDMCAAPGSKTTMIQSLAKNKCNLTAVELHKERFEKLKYNCKQQGANALLMNQSALDLNDAFKFDKILIDAPCSGSGTLDLNSKSYEKQFTEVLINKCITTQKKLIKKAAKLLPKGKTLIYSTCSLLKRENEDIVDYACKNGFEVESLNGKFDSDSDYIKLFPDAEFEGFFVAKLVRV